jgi:hypothetical protein
MLKWAISRDDQYTADEYIRLTIGGKKYRRKARGLYIVIGALVVAMPFLVYVMGGGIR